MVLFALTEAVPIFIAAAFMAFILFGLSVWHAENLPQELSERALAWAIILFGVLISVPTITAIGITWIAINGNHNRQGVGFLL